MPHLKIILTCLSCMCLLCQGDEVYLKSESTGHLYGPFEMQDGEHIQIGKSSFTVVEKSLVSTPATPVNIAQRLKGIRLPEVDFRNAEAEECVDFLAAQLLQIHPELGINFVVKRPKAFRAIDTERSDPLGATSVYRDTCARRHSDRGVRAPTEPAGVLERRVTLAEINATAYSVLEQIAEQAGFKIKMSAHHVTLVK